MNQFSLETRHCIEEALRCHAICLATAMTECLETGGEHVRPQHFRLMMDCVSACQFAADLLAHKPVPPPGLRPLRGNLRDLRARLRGHGRHGGLRCRLPLLRASLPRDGVGAANFANPMSEAAIPSTVSMQTGCCIAGGGPAGMVLGYLLARSGVDVTVLEKHKDFLRDFRGDTVHPSTLEIMVELGLLEEFLKRPHQELRELSGIIGGVPVRIADFSHVPAHCKFIALMPQWDFLDFLASHAKRFPNFRLLMQAEVTDLLMEGERIAGVAAKTPEGLLIVHADLVVGADGRHSIVRDKAALARDEYGVPIDVLWMRLSKKPEDSSSTLGRIAAGAILVTLDRGDYWQCAFVIPRAERNPCANWAWMRSAS